MENKYTVVGIGELLWDMFAEGKHLGGAPVNFAYHCGQMGMDAFPVSCIGEDDLGREIEAKLDSLGVDSTYVAKDPEHPTGTVEVELDSNGKPSYTICENVAWDFIPLTDEIQRLAESADAVCFGSLAQRDPVSRATIQAFLKTMSDDSLRIFDINLRQDFYSREVISTSLDFCNCLKINDEELPVLSVLLTIQEEAIETLLNILMEKFELKLIALTCGGDGSILYNGEEMSKHSGNKGEVVDSVGAGDSFAAALCVGLLKGEPLADINSNASEIAAYVCTQSGATPKLPAKWIAPGLLAREGNCL